ncbi:MAG: hypothetical protein ACXV0U_03615 [Kineosporiaceae bacterium]
MRRSGCAAASRFVAASIGSTTSPGFLPGAPVAAAESDTASRPTATITVLPSREGVGVPTVATPGSPT